jgi:membrane associated rhomboid family serine protease
LIPYKDDNPTRSFPFVTVTLIVLNVAVFIFELVVGPERIAYAFGALPAALVSFEQMQPIHPALTVFTSMFLHGGFLHLGGNMLYLWIFGDNIENDLGCFKFLVFYLVSGTVAAYAHAVTEPGSTVPMIGASGAVAGILGAYILLYPKAHVYTLLFLGFFIQVVRLPALIVIGFWAIIQLINGMLSGAAGGGGVAWFAHMGGFIFGVAAIKLFILHGKRRRRTNW